MHKQKRTLPKDKLDFFILFWIFFISCFLGVVIETIWSLFTVGHFTNRQGLVLGPFNLVYGFGGLFLTVCLHWAMNKPDTLIFAVSMFVGSSVEYICSLVQEKLFGSVSWDYSYLPFNLHGRICLLYAFFWGVLGVFWIKVVYPFLLSIIKKIPNRWHTILTTFFLCFMIINTVLSIGATHRWHQRQQKIEQTNFADSFFDQFFDDRRMREIYPDMRFKNE